MYLYWWHLYKCKCSLHIVYKYSPLTCLFSCDLASKATTFIVKFSRVIVLESFAIMKHIKLQLLIIYILSSGHVFSCDIATKVATLRVRLLRPWSKIIQLCLHDWYLYKCNYSLHRYNFILKLSVQLGSSYQSENINIDIVCHVFCIKMLKLKVILVTHKQMQLQYQS